MRSTIYGPANQVKGHKHIVQAEGPRNIMARFRLRFVASPVFARKRESRARQSISSTRMYVHRILNLARTLSRGAVVAESELRPRLQFLHSDERTNTEGLRTAQGQPCRSLSL